MFSLIPASSMQLTLSLVNATETPRNDLLELLTDQELEREHTIAALSEKRRRRFELLLKERCRRRKARLLLP